MPSSAFAALRDRELRRTIFVLAWPTITEHALQTIVQYIDTAQVGRLGAAASAAVGLTGTTTWLVNAPLWALATGVLACISQARGAGEPERAARAADQSRLLVLWAGALMTALTLLVSPVLPVWLGGDAAIRRDASLYFAITCAPMLFRVAVIVFGAVLRAVGDTRTPLRINLVMNILNVTLNTLLIPSARTVRLGALSLRLPGAGLAVPGAALATAASFVFGGTAMYLAARRLPEMAGRRAVYNGPAMRRCLRISGPLAGEHTASMLGQVVFTALIARLGTAAVAAHAIAITAEEAFYVPGYGMQTAASVLAGYHYGARDEKKLLAYSSAIALMAAGLMAFLSLFLFLFPAFFMRFFTPDPEVIALGARVLRIVSVSEPFYAVLIILSGTFHGVGDVRMPLVYSLVSMWGVRLCGTWLCVTQLHGGLAAAWCCMVADNLTRFVLLLLRYRGRAWRRDLDPPPVRRG